jgi:electron transfer flavoprotein alpha subunit
VARTDDITKAERIVVAGLGSSRDLSLAKKLAESLHAEFGASRPLADKGLVPKSLVVGSTGCSLNAKLVVVVGVSGAAHFISGIREAKTVIAINSDARAQIFNHADYCVNGDLFKIVPELIAQTAPSEEK